MNRASSFGTSSRLRHRGPVGSRGDFTSRRVHREKGGERELKTTTMGRAKGASTDEGGGGGGKGTFAPAPKGDPGPLLPSPPKLSKKRSLSAEAVGENAWMVRGVLTCDEAATLVAASDAHGYQHATSRGPKHGEAHRDHGRAGYEDPALAAALWADTGLDAAVAAAVGSVRGEEGCLQVFFFFHLFFPHFF